MKLKNGLLLGVVWGAISMAQSATAAEIKVLTTGAFKQVVVALIPEFEKATGHKVVLDNGTVGQLQKRVDDGETFDVLVLSPKGIEDYIKSGKIVAGSNANLAKVGVGVMVKEGAPKPDISTVEAFKQALLKAKSVGYIDPASGGSSGIYVAGLLDKLGIADQIKPKAKLQKGGHVSDLVKAGEAEIGVHQISEIVGQPGVTSGFGNVNANCSKDFNAQVFNGAAAIPPGISVGQLNVEYVVGDVSRNSFFHAGPSTIVADSSF